MTKGEVIAPDITASTIVQWNINGIKNNKKEIVELIKTKKASIVALQETLVDSKFLHKIDGFNVMAKNGSNSNGRFHGGVATYISRDVPYEEVKLNTNLQAVATTVHLGIRFTVCNLYIPPSRTLDANELQTLFNQLPKPCMMLGDFNAHHHRWGCQTRNNKHGEILERLISQNVLNVLNTGTPTFPGSANGSIIDLTITTPDISSRFEWSTGPSLLSSDHFPIFISTYFPSPHPTPIRLTKKANWGTYKHSKAWNNINWSNLSNEEIIADLYDRINIACDEAIPVTTPTKFFPKPWWTPELTISRANREYFYEKYRKNKTVANRERWSEARAAHKRKCEEEQNESWKRFISEFNESMPLSTLCRRVKKMKGIATPSIRILKDAGPAGQIYSDTEDIAERMAQNFAEVSSDNNYSSRFLQKKAQTEQNMPSFEDGSTHYYNQDFTINELDNVLASVHDSAPGEDAITYEMIKNLPNHVRELLVEMFNKFFKESFFPNEWRRAIIIPILKPGKDPSDPKSYRPIALTSCLCKIFERLLNERLIEFLIMEKVLSPFQCGCLKGRSTLDHLVRLEDEIRKTFQREEHFISVFFDLEKAYDMTWKSGIVVDMYKAGLRGLLPKYIAAFLQNRFFKVKIGPSLSSVCEQRNGVPQGAVLSPILFALKINGIIKNIPTNQTTTKSLFVDDLQLGVRGPDLETIGKILQKYLTVVQKWTEDNGLRFSPSKTNVVHFTKLNSIAPPPQLKLGDQQLVYKPSAKFLGLEFDSKLTWNPHLKKLKSGCQKLLGIMKMISYQSYGATQACLVKIYRTYVRSKLDYGSIVYTSATQTELQKLDVVANEALRIATGAFASTPVESLYVLANESKLAERRETLSLRYYLKIKSQLSSPVGPCISQQNQVSPTANNKTFYNRIQQTIKNLNLPKFIIQPEFSYTGQQCTVPKYAQRRPVVDRSLTKYPKETTPPAVYLSEFAALREEKFAGYNEIYTDGSKTSTRAGSAAVTRDKCSTATITPEASIYMAEAYALELAVGMVERSNSLLNVIYTDSRSCIESFLTASSHPTIRKVIWKLHKLGEKGVTVKLCWIPSHVGIRGNDRADQKAKDAAKRTGTITYLPIYYKDYYPTVARRQYESRAETWRTLRNNKLRSIKDDILPFPPLSNENRREEVVLNRVRAGHTRLTHGHIMESGPPPVCPFCNDSILTINHIFVECPQLARNRERHFGMRQPLHLRYVVGPQSNPTKIIEFLKNVQVFNEI